MNPLRGLFFPPAEEPLNDELAVPARVFLTPTITTISRFLQRFLIFKNVTAKNVAERDIRTLLNESCG